MKRIIDIDNLDDRREIRRLLDFLHPRQRWEWLSWVASQTASSKFPKSEIVFDKMDREQTDAAVRGCAKGHQYVSNTVYRLVFMIVSQHGIDWAPIEAKLVQLAKQAN